MTKSHRDVEVIYSTHELVAKLRRLADALEEDKPFRIVDGFRRFQAARDLGWTAIQAFVHREMNERQALRLAFAKNVVRRNLSPMEKAQAMHVATSRGMTVPEVAAAFGLSERHIRRYLRILELPEAIQVNPYDVEATAESYYRALTMATEERRARLAPLRERVEAYDVHRWAASFLEQLDTITHQATIARRAPESS